MPDLDASLPPRRRSATKRKSILLYTSYVADWVVLIAAGVTGTVLGHISPNKRPFFLQDPNISFPFTQAETVDSAVLLICNSAIPVLVILIVVLFFVPGPTVPKGTPKALIWKRKLWELHAAWLGLALSLVGTWFITSGMKNMFGKPRPDMLSRCQPDMANWQNYVIGGYDGAVMSGQLVSADICTTRDKAKLDDGFRSYPSGHASSAAAGLIYLSLFLASKFSVTMPFMAPVSYSEDATALSSFPSRARPVANGSAAYEAVGTPPHSSEELANPDDPTVAKQIAAHGSAVSAVRKQAAAPPLYLLFVTAVPFFLAIFIASSRWFDFRHHGFDILFGFTMGTIIAWFAFRYYHLPISQGAGWAWGPRSPDKAFWAGVGSYSYATDKDHWIRAGDEEAFGGHSKDVPLVTRHRAASANPPLPRSEDLDERPSSHRRNDGEYSRSHT